MINVINGGQKNLIAADSLKSNISKIKELYNGTAYFGFALSEIDDEKIIIDALIVTKEKGILAINFGSGDLDRDIEQSDRIFILLRGLLEKNASLRTRKELAISIQCITYCIDNADDNEDFVDEERFTSFYSELPDFQEKYFD